jgi:hypothetical protein
MSSFFCVVLSCADTGLATRLSLHLRSPTKCPRIYSELRRPEVEEEKHLSSVSKYALIFFSHTA